MSTDLRTGACALALAGLLSACGAGGGDGAAGGGSAGAGDGGTDSSTTLAFTTTNAGRVAGYPLWASELMLRIGQTVREEVAAAANQSGATVTTVNCASGALQRSWADKDGNGALGAGDEITLDFSACAREPLARSAQGRITVVLDSVTGSDDFVAGVVLPEPGLVLAPVVGTPGPTEFRCSGPYSFFKQQRRDLPSIHSPRPSGVSTRSRSESSAPGGRAARVAYVSSIRRIIGLSRMAARALG